MNVTSVYGKYIVIKRYKKKYLGNLCTPSGLSWRPTQKLHLDMHTYHVTLNQVEPHPVTPKSRRVWYITQKLVRSHPTTPKSQRVSVFHVVRAEGLHIPLHLAVQPWYVTQNLVGPCLAISSTQGVMVCYMGFSEGPLSVLLPFREPPSATRDLVRTTHNPYSARETPCTGDSHMNPKTTWDFAFSYHERVQENEKSKEQNVISNHQTIPNKPRTYGYRRKCKRLTWNFWNDVSGSKETSLWSCKWAWIRNNITGKRKTDKQ